MNADAQTGILPRQRGGLVKGRPRRQERCAQQQSLLMGFYDGPVYFRMNAEIIGVDNYSVHLRSP